MGQVSASQSLDIAAALVRAHRASLPSPEELIEAPPRLHSAFDLFDDARAIGCR